MAGGGLIGSWMNDQANVINNIAGSLLPIERLVTGAAYLIGLSFAFKAIYSLKVYGEARTMMATNTSIKEPLVYLLVAGIFIYFPTALSIMLTTTFGSSSIMQYGPVNSSSSTIDALFGDASPMGEALTRIIQTIGVIAFVRGWVLVARASGQGQQPGGLGKGMVHVFGGVLAINVNLTLQIINNTLYGTN